MADQCDAVLIVGSDYTDVAAPSELSTNARIAANLGAPVVLAVRAKDRTPDEVAQVVDMCLAEVTAQHAHTAAVVANRCDPGQMDAMRRGARTVRARSATCCPRSRCWSRPRWPSCRKRSTARVISGDPALLAREAMDVLVAGMTAEHVLERLTEGVAVITPGDRSDVVLAVVSAHAAEGFPSLSVRHPQRRACRCIRRSRRWWPAWACGCRSSPPTFGTFETASRGGVGAGPGHGRRSQRKIDTALALMDAHVDTADLLAQLAIPIPTVVTPQMFEYQLLDRARADRKHIVLPEGDDDRILTRGRPAAAARRGRPDDPRRRGPDARPRRRTGRRPVAPRRCSTRRPASCATSSPSSTPSCASTRASPSSRPARSSTTSPTSAP